MTNKNFVQIESLLFCKVQKTRLEALSDVIKLPKKDAVTLLKKALSHWDRRLRSASASMLSSILKEKSFPVLEKCVEEKLISGIEYVHLIAQFDTNLSFKYLYKFYKECSHINSESVLYVLNDLTCKNALFFNWKNGVELKKPFLNKFDSISNEELSVFIKKLPPQDISKITKNKRKAAYQYFKRRGIAFPEDYTNIKIKKKVSFLTHIAKKTKIDIQSFGWIVRDWNNLEREYGHIKLKKKSGGIRQILAPSERLKYIQRAINEKILAKQKLHLACHGFRKKKSIVTNAKPHIRKKIIINIDLKDFFPSISANRVYGIFKSIGYDDKAARFLTRVCTCHGILPQGAPTSPTLANLTCRLLDRRLTGLARKLKGRYTRYADDITFSGKDNIISAISIIRQIIKDEGFTVAEKKVRIVRKGNRQEVTGLTVNEKVSVPRAIRKKLRAVIHRVGQGKEATWNGRVITPSSLNGHLSHLYSVQPELAKLFRSQISNSKLYQN